MTADGQWLLEIRTFSLHPGVREEFDRVSREGTVPLMRREGIRVLAHGPALNDENGYYLLRAFPSEEQRVARSQAIYALPEWAEFEEPVSAMMTGYGTTVLPVSPQALAALAGEA